MIGQKKRIAVIGMGPGGMVAAIEAAEKGHQVLLIESRDHFSRSQRVVLTQKTIDYLVELNQRDIDKTIKKKDQQKIDALKKDLAFLDRVAKEKTVPINLLQEFLERKLVNIYSKQIEVRKGSKHKVKGIDLKANVLKVESNGKVENIKCLHIVGADGARHEMANMVNEAAAKAPGTVQVGYQLLSEQTRQEPHGTITFRVKKPGGLQFKSRALRFTDLARFAELGWDEAYLPTVYMFCDIEKEHFYVAGEIPRAILDEPDLAKQRDQLEQWGKLVLELQYGIKKASALVELDVTGKADPVSQQADKLKVTAFPLTLKYTETPCIPLPSGHAFVLLGDASKSGNFHLGHGANDAISDGRAFGRCLSEKGFDVKAYNEHQKAQREIIEKAMQARAEMDQNDYATEMTEIDKEVVKEAKTLIQLAQFHSGDIALQKAKVECEKAISSRSIDYDRVYLATLKLADEINRLAEAQPQTVKAQLKEKQAQLDKLSAPRSKVYKIVCSICSAIGIHLGKKNEAAKQALAQEIAALQKKDAYVSKEHKTKQKQYDKPQQYKSKKEKLKAKIVKPKAEPKKEPDTSVFRRKKR